MSLSRGLFAVVDPEDYARVVAHRWTATGKPGQWYAYRWMRVNGRRVKTFLHTFVLGLAPGEWGDHRDGDGLNNRRSNLRPATPSQNARNHHRTWGASRYIGVSRAGDRWRAAILVGARRLHLGYHATEEGAARAYDAAAREHFGEFAGTNGLA